MQPVVYLFFFYASSILCDDPDSRLVAVLRRQGIPNHLIDSFKEHLQDVASRRIGSGQQLDDEDNLIDKLSKEYDGVDLTRRGANTESFFNWFRNTFKAKKSDDKYDAASAFVDYLKENQNVQTAISNTLSNLTETFAKLNNFLEEQQKANSYVLVKVPPARHVNVTRVKRETAENITRIRTLSKKTVKPVSPVSVVTATDNSVNLVRDTGEIEPENVTRKVKSENVTKTIESFNVTKSADLNNTTESTDLHKSTKSIDIENVTPAADAKKLEQPNSTRNAPVEEKNCAPCQFNDTRRAFDDATANNDSLEVKQKLLTYIEEYFQEVKDQIGKLQQMKHVYSKNSSFRIGYILANVDILQDNINKLKQETAENHSAWTERQLIEVFDKLKASNKVMAGLIQTVKNIYYSDRNHLESRKTPTYRDRFRTNLERKDDTQ